MAPVVFNSSQVFQEAEVLKSTITAKKKDDFSVGGDLWASCQSLQDLYKSILLSDLSYALERKVEQELWNCAFKSHIDNMRLQIKERKNNKKSELQALLTLFLETASGFYIQLLNELCLKYALDVPGYLHPASLGILYDVNSNRRMRHDKKPPASASYYICQDCLVHLGDLARYRYDTIEAEVYYRQALQLVPTNGQPYNQLAILASSRGDTLGTVYFYCRSIAAKNPFPAASTNLKKTFSKTLNQSGKKILTCENIDKAEFVEAFIECHGLVCLGQDLNNAKTLCEKSLSKNQLERDELTASDLLKMTSVNIFLLYHVSTFDDADDLSGFAKDRNHESWAIMLDFIMNMFHCFLESIIGNLGADKKDMDESFLDVVLPAVSTIVLWFRANSPRIFKDETFNKFPIWNSFVHIVNQFSVDICMKKIDSTLPEDQELQGFLPLVNVLRKSDVNMKQTSKTAELMERKKRLVDFGVYLSRHSSGIIVCEKKEDGGYRFECINVSDKRLGSSTPFSETSSLFGQTIISPSQGVQNETPSSVHDQVGQYSLFQSNWNVPLTLGSTVAPNLISATPTSSNHPIKPSTVSSEIEDSAPRVTSRVVGSHRSPTIPNVSLPIPPTSLAVGSNRPLSPGHRASPSPSVEKFQPPSSFGLNFTLGSWSPLGNMTSNGHHDNGGNGTGGGKSLSNGNGNSFWGSSFHSAQSSMSPLEQLLKEQKSQQTS
ncbi:protein SMG7-like [Xenia sp. Carnegie-2017]|uniref:protein SMG7-like n=1 Tax=Xenia sp. Carnegie-2017 TaxID=2897299 RepID=UPI001F03C3E0|nr:protein SMG7-like [Xenia sp. Carnegie-2017]